MCMQVTSLDLRSSVISCCFCFISLTVIVIMAVPSQGFTTLRGSPDKEACRPHVIGIVQIRFSHQKGPLNKEACWPHMIGIV